MKAAVLEEDGISISELPIPELKPNSVLVRVAYCGICGSDIPRVLQGKVHKYPIILGHEFSGIVEKVGPDVKNIQVGDKVTSAPLIPCMKCKSCINGLYSLCSNYSFIGSSVNGAYAEYLSVPSTNVIKLPNAMSLLDAAMIEPCSVARHAFCLTSVVGKKVAIVGSGLIGLLTAQWSTILGASDTTIITHGQKNIPTLNNKTKIIPDGSAPTNFFDCVIDCAGTEESLNSNLQIASKKATIVLVGTPTSTISFTVKQWELINRKELTLIGSWMSYSAPFPGIEWTDSITHIASGQFPISQLSKPQLFPLSDINYVFDNIETLKKNGKIVLLINN